MKKIIPAAIAALVICSGTASAQSLKDVLKGVTNSSAVKDVIESVTGTNLNASIVGTWVYTGSAAALKSDNTLSKLAGDAAVTTVTDKIDGYLSKVGIKQGTFSYTFKDDGTFSATVKKKSVSGTYTIAEDGKTITMKYGQQLQFLSMTGTADITSSRLKLLFDADKLMQFLSAITKVAGSSNSTIATMSTLLESYDGMNAGFMMTKK